MSARRVSFAWRIREVSTMWSDEQAEYLHSLWKEGLSASQCAKLINNKFPTSFTRSACIGRVHRMGIADRPSRSNAKATRPRKPSPPARSDATPSRQSTERAAPEPDRAYRVDPAAAGLGETAAAIVSLGRGHCRWPQGDPGRKGFSFCRAPICGKYPYVYCEQHRDTAIAPRPGRKKPDPNRPFPTKTSQTKENSYG